MLETDVMARYSVEDEEGAIQNGVKRRMGQKEVPKLGVSDLVNLFSIAVKQPQIHYHPTLD